MGSVIVLIAYLVVVPLYFLLWGTFFGAEGFSLDSFGRAYGDQQALSMVINSVVYAVGSTVLAMVTGTLLAYVNVRTDAPFKGITFAASLVPMIMPAILYAPAWVFLASPDIGMFNSLLSPVFGQAIFDVYSIWGMIWVEGLHLAPIVFLLMTAAFRSMDPSLEESARVSGVRWLTVFRRITLPLVRPALMSGGLLVLVLGLESFEVPALIGLDANIYVFTSRIYFLLGQFPADFGAAGALGVGLIGIALVASLLGKIGSSDASSYQTVTGKAFRPRPAELGRARPFVGGAVLFYFLLTVAAPVASLLYVSLLPYYEPPSQKALELFTLDNYRTVLEMPAAATSFKNSLLLGIGSATAVMLLTTVAAWFVVRSGARGRSLIDGLAFTPLVIPGLVLGLAVSFVYLRVPLPVYGTLWILLIAYTTRFIPFGMRYAGAAMGQVANELEESAHISGATWGHSFRRILLPLTSTGILAGWIYVLMVSFRELSSSILLFNPETQVLSILIFQQFNEGSLAALSALGVLMVLALVVLVLIAYKVGSRAGVRMQ